MILPTRPSPPGPFVMAIAVCALGLASAASAEGGAARLRPGAIEIGLAGSFTSVAGSARTTLALRAGGFRGVGPGLAGFEAELGYHHVQSLDTVELGGNLSWQHATGPVSPFAAVGGGIRQETIGSFSQARYPVGFALGLRTLFGHRVAMRTEYRFRRVLGDPVADFTEHQALTGFSLLLRNADSSR